MARLSWPAGYDLCCSPDGRLMGAVGRNIVVVDLARRERVFTSHPINYLSSATFSASGEALAVKSTSGHIVVLNPRTGAVMADHQNKKEGEGSNMASSPDGEYLLDGSWDGAFTVRHMLSGQIACRDEFRGEMITRITHDERRRTWVIEHHPTVQGNEPWPAPGYLSVAEWPFSSLRDGKVVTFDCYLEATTVSPDGKLACFRDRLQGELVTARLADGEILARAPLRTGGTGGDLTWSTDGRLIGAVSSDGFAFFRASDLATVASNPAEYPSSILFHPNGDDVLLGTWNRSWVKPVGDICALGQVPDR